MSVRKILGRTGLILAALVALLLVARAALNYTTGKKLEKFLAAEKAKGVPLSYTDLGPACPGQDNAKPLWKAAAALFDERLRKTTDLNPALTNLFNSKPLDQKSRLTISEAIARNRRSIDLILEAAKCPCYREVDPRVISNDLKVNDEIKFLHLVRMLGFEALFQAEGGDIRGGLDEWIKGFRFIRLTLQEPELINALIAISNARSLLLVLDRIIDDRSVEVDDLKAVLKELDVESWRSAVAGSYKGERILWIETGRDVLVGRLDSLGVASSRHFVLWLLRPLVRTGFMKQYPAYDEITALSGKPYYISRPGMHAFDSRQKSLPWYRRLPENGISNISATGLKEASLEALMETARIGLAARIYRAREKHFPTSIADLVPGELPREPLDPFTGKPFVYRVDQNGLLVYSLGSNEKDDGGRGTYSITQLVMPKDDDWAWRDRTR